MGDEFVHRGKLRKVFWYNSDHITLLLKTLGYLPKSKSTSVYNDLQLLPGRSDPLSFWPSCIKLPPCSLSSHRDFRAAPQTTRHALSPPGVYFSSVLGSPTSSYIAQLLRSSPQAFAHSPPTQSTMILFKIEILTSHNQHFQFSLPCSTFPFFPHSIVYLLTFHIICSLT